MFPFPQDEKNEIMTTTMWVTMVGMLSVLCLMVHHDPFQIWEDVSLKWNTHEYGGVDTLYVPATSIWLPDVVLYNK
jgi:nicotinic acetylcholine receptor